MLRFSRVAKGLEGAPTCFFQGLAGFHFIQHCLLMMFYRFKDNLRFWDYGSGL